jgi:membrane protease YdiL (CAAX protease family)
VLRAFAKRLGIVAGIVISSVVFGLLHWQGGALGSSLSLVAGITMYGITFSLAARWTGRLGAPIVAHMLLNSLAAMVMVYEVFTGSKIS